MRRSAVVIAFLRAATALALRHHDGPMRRPALLLAIVGAAALAFGRSSRLR